MNVANHSADLTGLDSNRLNRITDHLTQRYIEPQKIAGCQLHVARHGHPAYECSLGLMDIERNKPMQNDTIFRIYSMSKPITSIALMQLYERGLFQLNDPIHRVIPSWRNQQVYLGGRDTQMELAPATTAISFKHILSHTAGLSYGNTNHPIDARYRDLGINRQQAQNLTQFVETLAEVPLFFEPGSRWRYSYATDVCGYLIEQLSGQPLEAYLKANIFEPLGMVDTGFSVASQAQDRFAANYQRGNDKQLQLIDDPATSSYLHTPSLPSGGGGLVGTTADYMRFCEMLRCGGVLGGERIIGARTLRLMHDNHLPGGEDLASLSLGAFSETAYEGVGFGLGFATTLSQVAASSLGPGDYYWGGAASTIFWVDPLEDLTLVFMTQLMPSATFNFRGQLKNILYSAIED